MSRARSVSPMDPGPDRRADATALSKSEIFDLLRNQRRRFVLHYLKQYDEEAVELGDLATRVAAWENEIGVEEVSSTQRKRVYTTLQQSHLPKMDRAGILEFEESRGLVYPTDELADLSIFLEIVPGRGFPWHEYYLGLGAVSCALMAAVWAGVYPFWFVPPIIWATTIATALTASAAVHVYSQRRMHIGDEESPPELSFER